MFAAALPALASTAPGVAAAAGATGAGMGAMGGMGGLANIIKMLGPSIQSRNFSMSFDRSGQERAEMMRRLFEILQSPRRVGGSDVIYVGGPNQRDAETPMGAPGTGFSLDRPVGNLSRFFR